VAWASFSESVRRMLESELDSTLCGNYDGAIIPIRSTEVYALYRAQRDLRD